MATHSSILVWRIPQREAWQAKVHRVARITAEAIENSHTVKLSGLGDIAEPLFDVFVFFISTSEIFNVIAFTNEKPALFAKSIVERVSVSSS